MTSACAQTVSTLNAAFQELDTAEVGLVNLKGFMAIMLRVGVKFQSPQLLDLLLASGAGFVRYGQFVDNLFPGVALESACPTPAPDQEPLVGNDKQVAALKAQIAELQASLKNQGAGKPPEEEKPKEPKGAQAYYDAALEELGGEATLKDCRLDSMEIVARVKKRPGIQPWEQDPVYLGLDPGVLMRDSEIASQRFVSACKEFQQMLDDFGLPSEILIAPMKGIVRALTKINVKYGGDVCQLSDITRATLHIEASGTETIRKTYTALIRMVSSPPEGVNFLHFDDRFLRPMFGGYRDFLFLISVYGILCEMQVNYDTILNVKENEGHEEYEVIRLNNDLMMDAAQKNDASTVKQHLNKGAMPNYRTARGFTALSYAAMHGNARMCSALISAKADPFQEDCTGAVAVKRAVVMGKLEAAEILITAMAEQCADMSRPVVVSTAARQSIIKTWAVFRNSRHDMSKQNSLQDVFHHVFERVSGGLDSALCSAAYEGRAEICVVLIEAKAQPNARSWGSDADVDRTSVDFAIEGGHALTVRTIMERYGGKPALYDPCETNLAWHGPDCQHPGSWQIGGRGQGKLLIERALQFDRASQIDAIIEASLLGKQWQPINVADLLVRSSELGAVDVACVALRRGALAKALLPEQLAALVLSGVRKNNMTLVMLLISNGVSFAMCGAAAREAAVAGQSHMISLLSEAGCPLEEQDENEEAPLHLAARFGHTEVVKLLHRLGCDLEKPGRSGLAATHLAVERNHAGLLSILIELGCDLNKKADKKLSLLHIAVMGNSPECIRALLAMGADPNPQDRFGGTPLMHAAYGDRLDALMALNSAASVDLDLNATYSANVSNFYKSEVSRAGMAAVHVAAFFGHVGILKALVKLRANLALQDADGRAAMDLAKNDAARLALDPSIASKV